ncbi:MULTISPECIES: DUF2262 domain-containing protein [Winogradskyella]|uniref:DUF2262 domain-containing protein n=1 Tax=Winogradskyella TaxID=286104 RepID=UPI0015C6F824|nr:MULTISPECIES: DUF2262 domain-containing protein [Winogradskyella]QXP78487.1 DUF2262 domain-containing protein [Winogradskyella sp. HaHa_3_26]
MKITKDTLKKDPRSEDCYRTTILFGQNKIDISLNIEDINLDDMIALGNSFLEDFEDKKKATDEIVNAFYENYNENWVDEDNGYPELSKPEFRQKLTITAIHFYAKDLIDVIYNEDGMFGNHYLIAQSYDGENFDDSTMFG